MQRITKRNKKILNEQCKEVEENNRIGKISLKILEISKENFMQEWT